MLLLHDDVEMLKREVKTFEYDENFNRIPKIEMVEQSFPTFTFMIGAEDESVVTNLMKLGDKYQYTTKLEGVPLRKIALEDNTFGADMYLLYKDGVLFLTNSIKQAGRLQKNRPKANLGVHKKALKDNQVNVYFDVNKLIETAKKTMNSDLALLNDLSDYKSVSFTSRDKKGTYHLDLNIKTDTSGDNSLKVIMKTISSLLEN